MPHFQKRCKFFQFFSLKVEAIGTYVCELQEGNRGGCVMLLFYSIRPKKADF